VMVGKSTGSDSSSIGCLGVKRTQQESTTIAVCCSQLELHGSQLIVLTDSEFDKTIYSG